jgi:amidase
MKFSKDKSVYCEQGPMEMAPSGLGKLTGYSFVFKDLFDVKGFKTGAGNPAWLESHSEASDTSVLIRTLLASGAECVGRVQTDELAYSLNGQNIHYGTPTNPIAPQCIPGGSSSGSAVAVAKKEADFSIGTDTGGSIRVPSSYCGLFGLRPTLGGLSLEHCFELAKSFDTAGIMTRSLPLLEKVFTQLSPELAVINQVGDIVLDEALLTYLGNERKARLDKAFERAGLSYVTTNKLARSKWNFAQLSELFRTIQGFEIIQKHGEWLELYSETLDQPIQERANWARRITSTQYEQALAQQKEFKHFIQTEWLSQHSVVILPTTPGSPPLLEMEAEPLAQYRSELMGLTAIAGLGGFPQLHIPMADLSMGPAGVSLLGNPRSEFQLFALAKALLKSGEQL